MGLLKKVHTKTENSLRSLEAVASQALPEAEASNRHPQMIRVVTEDAAKEEQKEF